MILEEGNHKINPHRENNERKCTQHESETNNKKGASSTTVAMEDGQCDGPAIGITVGDTDRDYLSTRLLWSFLLQ